MNAEPPPGASLTGLREAARTCTACELFEGTTQTVFSVGSATARLALVGEQPGDVEDRRGIPFVGPAGQVLDRALGEVGIERGQTYVTNAVKHFRFSQDAPGRRRIHQTPELRHLTSCKPWLVAELALVDPEVVVLLGATAAKSLLGPDFRVTRSRGVLLPRAGRADEPAAVHAGWLLATIHPSAVLRADDPDVAYAGFVADLRVAIGALSPAA
ncbi:MAG TPA: UdgX family uracil-DNA binding protein [Actinomycetes bacterium]|nr:UdgX family uracil-DNA binding protein [Actinomycetes bacterium]